jgi:hypothetical protein
MKTAAKPFEPAPINEDGIITVSISARVLVIPTGNQNILPNFNEYSALRGLQ